jgi:heme/copper-type cytochrome/quinol oxidase subunit 3
MKNERTLPSVPRLDVSRLPSTEMDYRSPIWWGNFLLLLIETTMFAIVVACYFYFRVIDFRQWPPVQSNSFPVMYHPVPDLLIPTINLVLIVISLAPMIWVDRACLHRSEWSVRVGLVLCIALGIAAIVLRFYEFPALHFRWDDNAYAGTVWLLLGLHLAHLITATCENTLMAVWVFAKGMDDKHARDIRVTTVYWYWVVGIWVLLYSLVYLAVRAL